tara:strand:+ start:368 stop:547 length:180 start_codon:yes stop_codon:yes gene_type:complete
MNLNTTPTPAALKAAEKIVWKCRIDYHEAPYIAALIDEEIAADKRMHALEQKAERVNSP